MEPTSWEVENSKVLALLEELKTNELPEWYGNGSNSKVYGATDQKILDKNTEELCSALQTKSDKEISKMSLEMQLWWRDHKAADKKRLLAELEKAKNEELKLKAMSKLTPFERKLLGLI